LPVPMPPHAPVPPNKRGVRSLCLGPPRQRCAACERFSKERRSSPQVASYYSSTRDAARGIDFALLMVRDQQDEQRIWQSSEEDQTMPQRLHDVMTPNPVTLPGTALVHEFSPSSGSRSGRSQKGVECYG
jgi:hypothetical protein